MTYWDTLPPTPKQISAIETYNCGYGVKIHANTKQQAHDVISTFVPIQKLDFNTKFVEGTKVTYDVVDQRTFSNYKRLNNERLDGVESIKIEDGMAIIAMRKKNNTINTLGSLNSGMSRMMDEPSHSDYEDSLGYLDEGNLKRESDMYGLDPIWWK